MANIKRNNLYGMMAEFDTPTQLVEATRAAHAAGYRKMEAYSPFPIEEVSEALHFHTKLPWLVFLGGATGLISGFLLQWYTSAVDYPIIVGGRPFFSMPTQIPIMFECTILGAALTAIISMIVLNGLPQPYHPVFNNPNFALASKDKFFLAIEAVDPKFDLEKTRSLLLEYNPREVTNVEK